MAIEINLNKTVTKLVTKHGSQSTYLKLRDKIGCSLQESKRIVDTIRLEQLGIH